MLKGAALGPDIQRSPGRETDHGKRGENVGKPWGKHGENMGNLPVNQQFATENHQFS